VSTLRVGGHFDFVGAVGFAIGLIGILLAISEGSEWGWASPTTLGLLVGGVAVLVAWAFIELRTTDALVDLRVAARRPVLLTNLASISVGFAFFITTAALPVLLEAPTTTGVGLGQTLIVSSLCLMPLGLVMFVTSPVAARLSNAQGPRTSLILGGLIITFAFAIAIWLHSYLWHIILVSTIVGLGVGFAYAAMPTLIMRVVPPTETAAANGLKSVMRTHGSTAAATLVRLIISSHLVVSGSDAIPTTEAFRIIFAMGSGVAIVGVIVAVFIPRRGCEYGTTANMRVIVPER